MTDLLIKKVIATDGERKIVDSSLQEKSLFISGASRPDFVRSDVLCVKFLISDSEDFADAEETCWYINTDHRERLLLPQDSITQASEEFSFKDIFPIYISETIENGSLEMPSNILPELLNMYISSKDEKIFDKYVEFEAELIRNNQIYESDSVKYELFIKSLE